MIYLLADDSLSPPMAEIGFDVPTIANAIHGLASQHDSFYRQLAGAQISLVDLDRPQPEGVLGLADLCVPRQYGRIALTHVIAGRARNQGKMILGLSLLGLSFLPGAPLASAGSAGAQASLARQLVGSAASFVLQNALSEQLSPQQYSPAGQNPSDIVQAPTGSRQGAIVPLVYGQVRLSDLPIISSSLTIDTQKL